MFNAYIKYDYYFKSYSKNIEIINEKVLHHWKKMLQDNEIIRDFKEMKLNEQILISYKEFL